jgi:hypothetical protein
VIFDLKLYLRSFTFSNPVSLACFYRLWPFIEFVQVGKHSLCVVGNANNPLSKWFFSTSLPHRSHFPSSKSSFARPVLQRRTPVNWFVRFKRKTFFKHLQKCPLCPFVVLQDQLCLLLVTSHSQVQ